MTTQPQLISFEIDAFIVDRRASNRSPRTIQYYDDELRHFKNYLERNHVITLDVLTANHIRQFLIEMATHRNDGGVHAAFRAVKAFIRWYSDEIEDERYISMMRKIRPPSPSKEPLPGVPMEYVRAMLDTCERKTLAGQRDRSILVTLVDTGVRRAEFYVLNIENVNLKTGAVQIIEGKGKKNRTVVMGATARRELIRYLRYRQEAKPSSPLYTKLDGEDRLGMEGLRDIIYRRAAQANIPSPTIHDFRRTFAIESLRGGVDIVTLMHLMGHANTIVLQRYLKYVEQDLINGHEKSSPGDRL